MELTKLSCTSIIFTSLGFPPSPFPYILYFQSRKTCRTSSRRRLPQSRRELLLQSVDRAQQQLEPHPALLSSSSSSRALTRALRPL